MTNTDRFECRHCGEPVTEDEDRMCLDCYLFTCAVNAGFPA